MQSVASTTTAVTIMEVKVQIGLCIIKANLLMWVFCLHGKTYI